MLLSTRIAIIVSLAFALAFGSLLIIGLQRETLASRPYTRIALGGQEALWREILDQELVRLGQIKDTVVSTPAFAEAMEGNDLPMLRRVGTVMTRGWLTSGEISDIQVLDAQGQVVYATSAHAEPPPLLDISTVSAVLSGATPAGLRQQAGDQFRAVMASQFVDWNGEQTVLAIASDARRPLVTFARAMDAEAYLVGTRGRLVEGTDRDLWGSLGLTFAQRVGTVQQAALADRLYAVTAIPVADLSAGSAGLLVALQDATDSLSALDRLTTLTLAVMAAVAALTVGGLYLYLRYSLAPLVRAVGILRAFSRGDTSVSLAARGDDEIGQIGAAISKLRSSLSAVDDARRQRELQRRRQERFVRKQMEALAETLEPGARDEVLSDLGRIVAATKGDSENQQPGDAMTRLIREDDQLGPIAAVLQQMSARVVEQHRRLSELVARLREALVRETRLASLQQELAIARDLQHSVLPTDMADRPTYTVKGVMESAQEVGGDFYDFFERGDGKLVFVIADVSGKGVPAAFFMAIARTLLKAIALFENDPAACVRQLNELLVVDNERMMFVTLVFGIFDPETGRVDFVNAGHLPPIRVGDGSAEFIESAGDMAVAVAETIDYSSRSITLAPGETLVLYTDGVTEAFSASGDQFGDERLRETLSGIRGQNSAALADKMLETVKAFEAGADQSDDITLLIVQRAAD